MLSKVTASFYYRNSFFGPITELTPASGELGASIELSSKILSSQLVIVHANVAHHIDLATSHWLNISTRKFEMQDKGEHSNVNLYED